MNVYKETKGHNEMRLAKPMIVASTHVYTNLLSEYMNIELNIVQLAQVCY